MAAHQHDHECGCDVTSSSVHQTLDEMEFERGLWSAALSGQLEDLEKRLQKGDDVNARDRAGYTALHYASRSGHLSICRTLLHYGSLVNAVTKTGQATALHRAAYMGHCDVIQLLLQHKADPVAVDADGMTPLHKAAEQEKIDAMKILVKAAPQCCEMRDHKNRIPADLTGDANLKAMLS